MAGDWIKMRVWLSKDPKVISMADYLSSDRAFMNWLSDPVQRTCTSSAYEHVTRNVTVALCVTGLLVTWGSAREQGDRENDDLVVSHCRLDTIDAMTDVPGFGDAMASVGWAIERENESLVFPNFFKDNESPDDRHKRQNAERQARHREKQARAGNVTSNTNCNVTVTHREEKRREEVNQDPAGHPSDVWTLGVQLLKDSGVGEKTARTYFGSMRKLYDDDVIAEAVRAAVGKTEPRAYIAAILQKSQRKGEDWKQGVL